MCQVFKLTRSAYYHWLRVDKQEDTELNELIETIFMNSYQSYGTRRIKEALKQAYGLIVSRRRIGYIMKNLGLNTRNKRRFRVMTTDSNHNYTLAPNSLKQDFQSSKINEKFVGDITYIPTKEGWLYLAIVIDLFSRKIVGWSMSSNMKTSLVNDALLMAIQNRQPRTGLIWHTDRGSQYASDEHKKLLKKYGIVQSMSRRGNCYDNAVSESFFHSLKTELTHHIKFETRSQANQAIFQYIEIFYNRKRLHSFNNYLSPSQFEDKMLHLDMCA